MKISHRLTKVSELFFLEIPIFDSFEHRPLPVNGRRKK